MDPLLGVAGTIIAALWVYVMKKDKVIKTLAQDKNDVYDRLVMCEQEKTLLVERIILKHKKGNSNSA